MKNLYELQVASVLSDYRLVINAGEDDGVKNGMTFIVYAYGDEIIDPETGESLGDLEVVKGKVKVEHVQKSMTTVVTAETETVRAYSNSALAVAIGRTEEQQVPKRLRDPEVGDLVRRVS